MKHTKNSSYLYLLFNLVWILPLVFIIGCKDKEVAPQNAAPSQFTVEVIPSDMSAVLTWTKATDADGDKVKYGIVLNEAEVTSSLEGTTYTLAALDKETSYSGKVVAVDGKGGFSETKFSFTTIAESNSVPEDFTVSTAVGGNGVTLSWTAATDPDGDDVKYDVELEGDNIKTDLTTLSHALTDLEYSKTYSGKIIAKDSKGASTEKTYSFTTGDKANGAPGDFTVTASVNGNGATISWTASTDPDGDAVKYDVELGGSSIKTGFAGLTHTLTALDYSKVYTGKIIARDGKGGTKEKSYTFTTGSKPNTAPGDFTVSTSVNGSSAIITWSASTDPDGDAVKYDVELGGSSVKTNLTGLTHTLTGLAYNTDYSGKVIAKDGKGGTKEKSYSFATGAVPNSPPGTFTASFDWLDNDLVGFSWTSAVDPDGDAVTYSTALDGTTIENGLTGNEATIGNLLYSTNYTIVVTASDGKGGTSSDSFTFTTLAAPPEFPVSDLSFSLTEGDLFQSKDDYEFGLEFEPTQNGKITALGARLCFGNYKITLWDVDTKSIITSTNVNITAFDCETLTMVNIAPVNVVAGKKYMVTTNANNWYRYEGVGGGNILPATKGNIKFNRYGWILTLIPTTTFPTTFQLDYFAGIVEFEFVPDH